MPLFTLHTLTPEQRLHVEALIAVLLRPSTDPAAYTQAKGCLHRHKDGYCCLGVACDLFNKATHRGEWITIPAQLKDTPVHFTVTLDDGTRESNATTLSSSTFEYFGFPSPLVSLLIAMNDAGAPFPAIAQLLQHWLSTTTTAEHKAA